MPARQVDPVHYVLLGKRLRELQKRWNIRAALATEHGEEGRAAKIRELSPCSQLVRLVQRIARDSKPGADEGLYVRIGHIIRTYADYNLGFAPRGSDSYDNASHIEQRTRYILNEARRGNGRGFHEALVRYLVEESNWRPEVSKRRRYRKALGSAIEDIEAELPYAAHDVAEFTQSETEVMSAGREPGYDGKSYFDREFSASQRNVQYDYGLPRRRARNSVALETIADRTNFLRYYPSLIAVIHCTAEVVSYMRWQFSAESCRGQVNQPGVNFSVLMCMLDGAALKMLSNLETLCGQHETALEKFEHYEGRTRRSLLTLIQSEIAKLSYIGRSCTSIVQSGHGVIPDHVLFDPGLFKTALSTLAAECGFSRQEGLELLSILKFRKTVYQRSCCPPPMDHRLVLVDIVKLEDLRLPEGSEIYSSFFNTAYEPKQSRLTRSTNIGRASSPATARFLIGLLYCTVFMKYEKMRAAMVNYAGVEGPSKASHLLYDFYMRSNLIDVAEELEKSGVISAQTRQSWHNFFTAPDITVEPLFDQSSRFIELFSRENMKYEATLVKWSEHLNTRRVEVGDDV